MQPPRLTQQVTFLYVSDLEASAEFYAGLLGLDLILDQGVCRIYQVSPTAFLGLCRRNAPPGATGGVIITLVTPDVDAWAAYLKARGVALEKAPTFNPDFNIYHLFLRDPDGYLVEIQRFLDPTWPSPA